MTRFPAPSRLCLALALALTTIAAVPARASQLEGDTIGTPRDTTSSEPARPRPTGDRHAAPRPPAAPASGAPRGR